MREMKPFLFFFFSIWKLYLAWLNHVDMLNSLTHIDSYCSSELKLTSQQLQNKLCCSRGVLGYETKVSRSGQELLSRPSM